MQNFSVFRQKLRKICKKLGFIKIDFSFLLIFVFAIIIEEVSLYFCFVIFLILHELSHYLVAKKLGYMAGRMRLSFFGASLEGLDDFSLRDEVRIVLAGPLFNLFMVVLCYLCYWFYPESYEFLNEVQLANFGILLFNILPIFPLDMGRLLLAAFSVKRSRADALKITKTISFVFILLMFLGCVVSCFFSFNFLLGLASVNLMVLMLSRAKDTAYKREIFIDHKLKKIKNGLIERSIYVMSNTPSYKLFRFIDDYHFITFHYVDNNFKTIGTITEIELYRQFYQT